MPKKLIYCIDDKETDLKGVMEFFPELSVERIRYLARTKKTYKGYQLSNKVDTEEKPILKPRRLNCWVAYNDDENYCFDKKSDLANFVNVKIQELRHGYKTEKYKILCLPRLVMVRGKIMEQTKAIELIKPTSNFEFDRNIRPLTAKEMERYLNER